MTQEPARARFDRTTWIVFVAVLAVGLVGISLVAWRITGSGSDSTGGAGLPEGHLHGRVTVDGEPRAAVPVVVARVLPDGSLNTPLNGLRRSTDDGGFIFNGLEPGAYRVSVSAGLPVFTGDFVPLDVAGKAFGEAAEVELPSDHGVGGVARPDARRHAQRSSPDPSRDPEAGLPVRAELLDEAGEPTGMYGETVTDRAGRWEVTGLPPGEFRISSSDAYDDGPQGPRTIGSGRGWEQGHHPPDMTSFQDQRRRSLGPVRVSEGAAVAAPDLVLRRTTTLRGTVRDPDGRPVRGVEVAVHAYVAKSWVAGPAATSDRRGRYEIPRVVPGSYRLGVTTRGGGFLGEAPSAEESDPLVVRPGHRVQRGLDLVVRRQPEGD